MPWAHKAQSVLRIGATPFSVRCNQADMTAEIYDDTFTPDEHKYPIMQHRKLEKWNKNTTLQIPSAVTVYGDQYTITKIGRCAFAGYENLLYVEIPTTVTEIDEYAFFRSAVVDVQIPGSVKSIGKRAFGWCKNLKNLCLPSVLDYSGENLFTESKNVNLTYSQPIEVIKREVEKREIVISDVDIDVPHNPTDNANTFVVIIANEKYDNMSSVDYALSDGRSFRNYCQMTLGIPSENIHIRENATYNHMKSEMDWISNVGQAYDGDAKIIFYYAGHGIPNDSDKAPYLMPVDATANAASTGFSLQGIYSRLGKIKSDNIAVFLDACFSGTNREGELLAQGERGIVVAARDEEPLGSVIAFSASQGTETAHAYAEQGHGMFTYFLLKKLQETSGKVTYGELADYVIQQVRRRSAVNSQPQTPTVLPSSSVLDTWRSKTLR